MKNLWQKQRFILDTHTFIWYDSDPLKIPEDVSALLEIRSIDLILSVASIWEMQIKIQLGKLKLELSLAEIIESQQQTNDIRILSVELPHVLALDGLPSYHKDPFDRLLIAQATVEDATIISGDPIFKKYPVSLLW